MLQLNAMSLRAWAMPTVEGGACAAALTVGLIFWLLFYQEKSNGKLAYHSPENVAAHELGKMAGDGSVLRLGQVRVVVEQAHG